jgi:NitT/TauT family transport system substrate-binding protein
VDAAVTYEPYISAALKQGKEFHVLYTAAEKPGLISDLALADRNYIEKNPEVIKALILAWDDAVTFLKEHPEEGGKIIADAVHSPMDEFKAAMDGVKVYDLKGNAEILGGEFQGAMADIGRIMMATNPSEIKRVPQAEEALAIQYVKDLAK